jgi:hypothetical protein
VEVEYQNAGNKKYDVNKLGKVEDRFDWPSVDVEVTQ